MSCRASWRSTPTFRSPDGDRLPACWTACGRSGARLRQPAAARWTYWRYVAFRSCGRLFGATLLLFANAFSAYATAKRPDLIASPLSRCDRHLLLTSEVVLGQANLGKALAFGMILVVATMAVYAMLQKRTSRWLR